MRTPIAAAVLLAFAGWHLTAYAQITGNSSAADNTSAPAAAAPVAASAASTRPATAVATPAVPLDTVEVTASRMRQVLADALPQTTVFDRQAIQDCGASDLASLLSMAPGVQISTSGSFGSTSGLFMRGADSTQSLILIDGVRVDSTSLGMAQLAQLQLDQIDRVEVVNGNVSALYGSGAIGGVVQIFTKKGGDHTPYFNFETELGSYGTQRQRASAGGALDADGKTTFDVTVSRFKTDGFSSINPVEAPGANPNKNGFQNTSVDLALKHQFNSDWDAGVGFYESSGRDSFDNAYGLPTDINDEENRVRTLSAFVDGKLTDRWTTHLKVAEGDDQTTAYLNQVENGRFNSTNRQFTWQNDFALTAEQKLMIGYEHLDQSLDSDQYSVSPQHVNSAFAGYEGKFGANQFQLNVRHDQYSNWGGANSYYAGYGYNFTPQWKYIASYSDSFRAPTFNDLYYPNYGNPALLPERSHSVESAIQYDAKELGLIRLTAFQTRYTNLIQSAEVNGGNYIAQNVGHAKVQGLESSWVGEIGLTDVRASFTIQNPVNLDTDTDLVRRARRFFSVSANRSIADWRIGGQWLVSGVRNDSGTDLGGYGVLNLTARYNITKSWYVSGSFDNVFNKHYELVNTYNTPGRGAYITLGWSPK